MDAVIAMEGFGPVSGRQKRLGLVIASNDAVALDSVVCNALGLKEINTLKKASELKAGETELKKIRVFGKIAQTAFEKPFTAKTRIPEIVAA